MKLGAGIILFHGGIRAGEKHSGAEIHDHGISPSSSRVSRKYNPH